jgi:S1-C subfamily serine protease
MPENRHFVRSTNLSDKSPALIGGSPAALSYRSLIDSVEALAGREAASLFAEPVLPHKAAELGATVSWYCAYEGAAQSLNDIDGVGQRPVAQKLTQRLEALGPALRDPVIGQAIASWLNLSSASDILSVGGEPVLINWGFLPKSIVLDDAGQLSQHFARTLGRYFSPTAAVPPVNVPAMQMATPPVPPATEGDTTPVAETVAPSYVPPPPIPVEVTSRYRPWLAPAVATAIAAAALLILLLPGVLVYPASSRGERDTFEEQRLHASNDSLEAQVKAMQGLSQQKLCRLQDSPIPVPGLRDQTSNAPEPRMDPVPRAPEDVRLPRSSDSTAGSATNVGELLDHATVMIFALKPPDEASQGSGFFIDDRHIVTNHHVVAGVSEDSIFVASRALGGFRHARLVAKTDPPPSEQEIRPDFAVLEVTPVANGASLKLGTTPPKLSTAYIAGFPGFITQRDLDFRNFVNKLSDSLHAGTSDETLSHEQVAVPSAELKFGRINNTMSTGRNAIPIVLHDMQLAPGNSGGPLIDACGRLGGVNTLLFKNDEGAQQANVAQDVGMLRKFLTDNHISFVSDDGPCNPEVATNTPRPNGPPTNAPAPNAPTPNAPPPVQTPAGNK